MNGGGISRRTFLTLTGLTVAGVALGACGRRGGAAGGGGEVMSSITLGINNPNYATQIPIFVAEAQGYFEEVGIEDFEVVTTEEYVAGLIGGSLHISQGDTDVWLGSAHESGEPIRFLGTYRDKEWQIMGVGPGIEAPEDLVGKRVTGGSRGSRNEFIQRKILERLGVDPDRVEFVEVGGGSDARLQAILAGQVDAASLFPRHRQLLEEGGGKFIYEELTENPQEGMAAMGSWLEENGATVTAYITANLRARQYMQDLSKQDEIIELMRSEGFEIPPEFEPLYPIEIEQISPDGGFTAEGMDALVAEQIELGLLPEGLEWRDHLDVTYLWEAQDAVGLPRRPDPDTI